MSYTTLDGPGDGETGALLSPIGLINHHHHHHPHDSIHSTSSQLVQQQQPAHLTIYSQSPYDPYINHHHSHHHHNHYQQLNCDLDPQQQSQQQQQDIDLQRLNCRVSNCPLITLNIN